MNRKPFLLAAALALFAFPGTASAGTAGPRFHPRPDALPFSEAVQVGDVLYLSGQLGQQDGALAVVPGGIEAEARRTMELIGRTLGKYGLGYDDLFKCTVMLADMKDWPAFNAIYASYFKPGHFPARSAMGVGALALGARVEVECLAYVRPKR